MTVEEALERADDEEADAALKVLAKAVRRQRLRMEEIAEVVEDAQGHSDAVRAIAFDDVAWFVRRWRYPRTVCEPA